MERGKKRAFNKASNAGKHIRFDNDGDDTADDKDNIPSSRKDDSPGDKNNKSNSREENQSDNNETNNDSASELDKLNPTSFSLRKRKQHQKSRKIQPKNTKKGRIIVRNLSFKSTEENLKKHFEQFGTVTEVTLLKKPDGKLVGCGFIQYDVVQNAARALYNLSGKPFLGRDIVCDWALGKSTYVKNMQEAYKAEIKEENETPIEIKDEANKDDLDLSIVKDEDVKIKDEINDNSSDDDDDKTEITKKNEDNSDSDNSDNDSSDEIDGDDEESDNKSEVEEEEDEEPEVKRPRVISNDTQEGKTVFIKNLPFSATNEDVKQCMEQFGPVLYALVCVDKLTEYSKGTAFVKFKNLEDADKCLAAGTELTLMANVLDCHRAISKSDLEKKNFKPEVKRDSRHLYLVKEGVILAGTSGAQGLSASDMAKRLELERWKTQILRNLNMFVSLYRLIIHNLPLTYDDKQLKALFAKYAGPKAVIREAKVMRDLRNMGPDGKSESKGHGFVAFAQHEDALKALRAINNNPSIFTRAKRPIVAFSIENKSVINARTKRLQKSRINNPNSKEYDPNAVEKDKAARTLKEQEVIPTNAYSGVAAKPGVNKLRSKYKLSTQAQLHHQNLKEEKRRMKLTRKSLKKKKNDYLKQAKQKKGKFIHKDNDNFSKIVDKYTKTNNKFNKSVKKQKWYET